MRIRLLLHKGLNSPVTALYAGSKIIHISWLIFKNCFSRAPMINPGGPVISMTTFGSRLATVYLTIESIAGGSCKPSRMILWLDDAIVYEKLPRGLRRLVRRGLEVRVTVNLGPHKKYYPYLASLASFEIPLVTADDDVLYPKWWLRGLIMSYKANPELVHCYRARKINLNDEGLTSYHGWALCRSTEASFCHIAIGVSGVLYPPVLQAAIKAAGSEFVQCCPSADDLWLHVQAIRNGFKIRQVRSDAMHFPMIPGTQAVRLYSSNVLAESGNDRQIRQTYQTSDLAILRGALG